MQESKRGARRSAFFLLSTFTLLGGCAPTFPLSAEMSVEASHYEVVPSAKAFVPTWELSVGPYLVKVKQVSKESEDGVPDRLRTTRVTKSDLVISREGAPVGTVACQDLFAWVQLEGTMFANEVEDEFKCQGSAGGEGFSLVVQRDGDGGYNGSFTAGDQSTKLHSVHGRQAGVKTLTLGYSLGEGTTARAVVRDPARGNKGDLWAKESLLTDAERAAMLSLLVFREGE